MTKPETILSRNATLEERKNFIAQFEELKRNHHAVTLDEVKEQGSTQGELRLHHYMTCCKCKEKAE
jgi:hypothetical protein